MKSAWLMSPVYHLTFGQVAGWACSGCCTTGLNLQVLQGRATERVIIQVK